MLVYVLRGIFSSICFGDRLEAAMQRLTNLCSVLNDMEPICVLNHVFVLREVSAPFSVVYTTHLIEFLDYHLSEGSKMMY